MTDAKRPDTDVKAKKSEENGDLLAREREEILKVVAAHSNRKIYRYDIQTKTAYADAYYGDKSNWPLVEKNLPDSPIDSGMVISDSAEEFRRAFREMHEGKPDGLAIINLRNPKGELRWVEMKYSVLAYEGGEPRTAVISYRDITEEHEKEVVHKRYRQTIKSGIEQNSMLFFDTDLTADRVEELGGAFPGIPLPHPGATHDEVSRSLLAFVDEDTRGILGELFSREHLLEAFNDRKYSFSKEVSANMPDGKVYWYEVSIQLIEDPYSGHVRAYTRIYDITEEKTAELKMQKEAYIDGMTGLYNKSRAEELIKKKIQTSDAGACALVVIDLDGLKSINDNFGHGIGDVALEFMSSTLQSHFRKTDILGRIGGDEFIVFMEGSGNEVKLRSIMAAFMRKMSVTRMINNKKVTFGASIGIAIGKTGYDSYEELFRRADKALYHVKRNGKNDFAFYEAEMEDEHYEYERHDEESIWDTSALGNLELNNLLRALAVIYPLIISVNLTKNSYYMMQYYDFETTHCLDSGKFDELIEGGAETFHPEDRQGFIDAYSRENLLKAYEEGKKVVSYTGRQLGDDGIYRQSRTDVVFVEDEGSGDILEISLGRTL